jgi:hypothetical protein
MKKIVAPVSGCKKLTHRVMYFRLRLMSGWPMLSEFAGHICWRLKMMADLSGKRIVMTGTVIPVGGGHLVSAL